MKSKSRKSFIVYFELKHIIQSVSKYKIVLPPLSLLSKEQTKQMIKELKDLDFYPERKAA